MDNYFEELNSINVNDKTEKKNGLTYLSWAWAWGEVKKKFPDAAYTIYENADGWNYFTDGRTAWVKTGVTVNGLEHIEYLPVMDYKNKSIRLEDITSFDVNKAIQRSLTKAVARHGLGLYIYAGEDLPEGETPPEAADKKPEPTEKNPEPPREPDTINYATPNQVAVIRKLCNEEEVQAIKNKYGVSELALLPRTKAVSIIKKLKERGRDGE